MDTNKLRQQALQNVPQSRSLKLVNGIDKDIDSIAIRKTNIRYGKTIFQNISHHCGRKPIQCMCKKCQMQCHTPCLGTPQDILKLIDAGYGDRLELTGWAAGIIMGVCDHIITMVQPRQEDGDHCTFFHNDTGKCELHELGLKPTEGRLSSHLIQLDNFQPKKSLAYNVAKEWEDTRNNPVIARIVKYIQDNEIGSEEGGSNE